MRVQVIATGWRSRAVLGQPTAAWPDGVLWHHSPGAGPELIAIADSGNHRIVLWERP